MLSTWLHGIPQNTIFCISNLASAEDGRIVRGPDLPPSFTEEVESTSIDEYLIAMVKQRINDVYMVSILNS